MWSPGGGLAPDPATALHVRSVIGEFVGQAAGLHAVIATAALRPLLAEFFEQSDIRVDVFAYTEIPPEVSLEPAGVIDAPRTRAA
jgi:flagellar biosynthesis component FlhA